MSRVLFSPQLFIDRVLPYYERKLWDDLRQNSATMTAPLYLNEGELINGLAAIYEQHEKRLSEFLGTSRLGPERKWYGASIAYCLEKNLI